MGCYTQCLVDGPCYVLFSGELQQPGVNRYFCGLCGARGFCAKYYGPPDIYSHLLRALYVADSCSDVDRPKCYGCYEVGQVRRAFSSILGISMLASVRLDRGLIRSIKQTSNSVESSISFPDRFGQRRPRVKILGADQKDRGLWERDCRIMRNHDGAHRKLHHRTSSFAI